MKTILLYVLLLCAITLPLSAQSEVDNTLKADVRVLTADVRVLTEDVRVLTEDVLVLKTDFKNLKENVINGFDRIEKNFDRQNNIIIACIGLPMAILAIVATVWGILAHRRAVRDSAQREEIETLKAEVEILKQRHIVSP